MRVIGRVRTKYGVMSFRMENAKQAHLSMDVGWVIHRVEYVGSLTVYRVEPEQLRPEDMNIIEGWAVKAQTAYIRRKDGKDINHKSDTLPDIKHEMLGAWATYISSPKNSGVLLMAARNAVNEERAKLVGTVVQCTKNLSEAEAALSSWDTAKGDLQNALNMGVKQLTTDKYDATTVKIVED